MSLSEKLVEELLSAGPEGLCAGNTALTAVADQYGTPFYCYLPAVFRARLATLRAAVPDADIYYSIKANPTPAVVQTFVKEGTGIEIASSGELAIALAAGISPDRILFAGPGKREDELADALNAGIGEFHAESFTEIERLASLSQRFGRITPVAIRVNAGEVAKSGAIVMSGGASPFGIDEERMFDAIDMIMASPHLEFSGLHFYAGTQILDYDVLIEMYSYDLALAADVCRHTGQPLQTIDFGGGFGVPYFDRDTPLDIESFGREITPRLRDARNTPGLAETRMILEPGRYLVAEGGLYIARVIDKKVSREVPFLILDGGIHHNIAPAGHFGQLIKRNFPIVSATDPVGEPADDPYTIVGPLCTPLDTMGRSVPLPETDIGDLIVFLQAGAYSRTASPAYFLSHPEPLELMVENGTVTVARERQGHDRLFGGTDSTPPVMS